MEIVHYLIDLFLHLDKHLSGIIAHYGAFTYLLLFMVIFCETGLVITPFLPGDSLIFAAATFAAKGVLNVNLLFVILVVAAVLGDTINYWIGHYIGPRVFEQEKIRFLKKEYLVRTHNFYEKYGGKTIILGRFIPIIRTFVPFVAGVGSMTYSRFIVYNVIGGIAWVTMFLYGGFFFGNLDFVKNHFSIVILMIIFISILPGITEFLRHKLKKAA